MLANLVEQTTITATAGDLTLIASDSDHQDFNDYFGTSQYFYYFIRDLTNNEWESGVGHLTTSTNLVRDKVLSTSTTPKGTATPLTLSAGTKTVHCATPHSSQAAGVHTMYTGASHTVLKSAAAIACANGTQTADRVMYTPYKLETGITVTTLSIYVTTGSAGDALLGVYDWDHSDGGPGDLLTENNLTVTTGTTGLRTGTLTTPVYLGPGWYWVAVACEATPQTWGSSYNDQAGGPMGLTNSIGRSLPSMREAYSGGWTTPVLPASGGGTYTEESYNYLTTLFLGF